MTWWAPARVAGYAQAAGFRGDDLTVAVAVALAGSGGEDSAAWSTLTPPRRETRGLWLIPVGTVLSDPDGALFDPATNAAVAYALTVTAGAGWGWSTVHRAGTWRQHLDQAAAAAAHPMFDQPSTVSLVPINARDGGRAIRIAISNMTGKARINGK